MADIGTGRLAFAVYTMAKWSPVTTVTGNSTWRTQELTGWHLLYHSDMELNTV